MVGTRYNQDELIFLGPPCSPDDIDIFACPQCQEQTKCRADVWIDTCWHCSADDLVFLGTVTATNEGLFAA